MITGSVAHFQNEKDKLSTAWGGQGKFDDYLNHLWKLCTDSHIYRMPMKGLGGLPKNNWRRDMVEKKKGKKKKK